jgi:hypothetical protein
MIIVTPFQKKLIISGMRLLTAVVAGCILVFITTFTSKHIHAGIGGEIMKLQLVKRFGLIVCDPALKLKCWGDRFLTKTTTSSLACSAFGQGEVVDWKKNLIGK